MLLVKIELLVIANILLLACDAFVLEVLQEMRKFWLTRNLKTAEPGSYLEDAFLTTNKLIQKNHRNAETHYVTTEDGYILGVDRIPNPGKQPVLLQHGLLDTSASFVLMGPENSLAYILADNGYDVWISNARGNRYSRNHTILSPEKPEFWEFSWHEMGIYDLPAVIDYVLNTTGFAKLHYIGHSQGCTAFFVMGSKMPEYNDKILLMQALAPGVFMDNLKTLLVPYFRYLIRNLREEFTGEVFAQGTLRGTPCFNGNSFEYICLEGFFALVGRDAQNFNNTLAPVLFSHSPGGSSLRQLRHFNQLMNSGEFLEYDFGSEKNQQIYGLNQPPKYNLSEVTAPVVIHYAMNDYLVTPTNALRLYKTLSNIKGVFRVAYAKFNHMDFLWGINQRKVINNKILSVMQKFENDTLKYTVE